MTASKPAPRERTPRITVPARCHPFAKIVFGAMRSGPVPYAEVSRRSGVTERAIRSWRVDKNPGLKTGASVLGTLGWSLLPIPSADRLPPAIAEGLADLDRKWPGDVPLLHYLIAGACGVPILVERTLTA